MYLVVGEPVSNDPGTFMDPQCQDTLHIGTSLMLNMQQPLPDPREIPQVENVVKFSRCGKHFDLREGGGKGGRERKKERNREEREERETESGEVEREAEKRGGRGGEGGGEEEGEEEGEQKEIEEREWQGEQCVQVVSKPYKYTQRYSYMPSLCWTWQSSYTRTQLYNAMIL